MEQKINSHRLGMVVGAVAGLWHVGWSVLVVAGVAQALIDFVFRVHFMEPLYHIGEFSLGTAVALVLVTSIIGYIFGWLIGTVWNRIYRS
ncbi:MAG: hypothetical protein Q7S83_00505 [bacterium]|nr:hypothetical protein [bacterium]